MPLFYHFRKIQLQYLLTNFFGEFILQIFVFICSIEETLKRYFLET